MKTEIWPQRVKKGNAVVTIYREKSSSYAGGFRYKVYWREGSTARHELRPTAEDAHSLASLKASQLNSGYVESASMTVADRDELRLIREICGAVPPVTAVREWRAAHDKTHGHVLAAAEAWSARHSTKFTSIEIGKAIDDFIKTKESAGKKGERTYRAKLDPLREAFPGRLINTIKADELEVYLSQYTDGVTRNDFRKRAVALWRWAYKRKHLPAGAPLEIELTERAEEDDTEIGILSPDEWRKLLQWTRETNINLLAPLVLAGFCGIRSEEIHGKRGDYEKRQTWEDVNLDRKYVRVTLAKRNTPSWRIVPLCDAAVKWLQLCPNREGVLCEYGAMWKLRVLAKEAGFTLPPNCFRHSFISYRIVVADGKKQQVATEAGNSVDEIDARYRVPVIKEDGEAWFSSSPSE